MQCMGFILSNMYHIIYKTTNLINNKYYVGMHSTSNSQFGSCWVTKEGINKKIKKEELGSFIETGWMPGRII